MSESAAHDDMGLTVDGAREDEPVNWADVAASATDGIIHPELPPEAREDSSSEVPEGNAPSSAAERVRAALRRGNGRGGKRDDSQPSGPREKSAFRPAAVVPPKPREGSLVKPLTDLYTTIGLTLAPFDPVCSTAVLTNAEECARRLEALARENESVRRIILAMVQTSAWGGVIAAHLPIIAMVMTHHGPEAVRERAAGVAMITNPAAMQQMMQEAEAAKRGDSTQ